MHAIEDIEDPVVVNATSNRNIKDTVIHFVIWRGRRYAIAEISYSYPVRKGRKLVHIFHTVGDGIVFTMRLDTDSQTWAVIGVHEHEPLPPEFYDETEHRDVY